MRKIFENDGAIQRKVFEFRFYGKNKPEGALFDILISKRLRCEKPPNYADAVTIDAAGNKSAYLVRAYEREMEDGFHILTMDGKIEWPFSSCLIVCTKKIL